MASATLFPLPRLPRLHRSSRPSLSVGRHLYRQKKSPLFYRFCLYHWFTRTLDCCTRSDLSSALLKVGQSNSQRSIWSQLVGCNSHAGLYRYNYAMCGRVSRISQPIGVFGHDDQWRDKGQIRTKWEHLWYGCQNKLSSALFWRHKSRAFARRIQWRANCEAGTECVANKTPRKGRVVKLKWF